MVLRACFAYLLVIGISSGVDFKLSDSKLLLPYFSSASVNYTITGSGHSCYEWWSGSPEVVAVSPIGSVGEVCANRASVTAIWQSALRRTATIYARESGKAILAYSMLVTRHVLECDVIVDDIHSIKIDTTTQELYLHNTPASLVVVGHDEFGNTFSSLDGIPFEWKIHAGSAGLKTAGDGVLRFLTWTESEYTTPSRIGLLEAEGMQLVSGLRTGSAVVTATLRESTYSHVPSAKVRLLVMANAQLNPPVLYLIPSSLACFQVNVVRQDANEEVMMPSKQYYLSVADETVIELDADTGSAIVALKYGQTTVTLLDRNVEEAIEMLGSGNSDGNDTETQMLAHHRRPTSIVYVVEPAYFQFTVHPVGEDARLCITAARQSFSQILSQGQYNHWALEIGKTYKLFLDLYDQNNHRIFPADNIRISVIFPDGVFNVSEGAENGTVHTIIPQKTGTFTIKSTLEGVAAKTGEMKLLSHPVTGSQELIVYSPLNVFPSQVNVAWDASVNVSEGYALAAEGGSGDYVWAALPGSGFSSSGVQTNKADVVVSVSSGLLFAKGIGTALVVVSDLRNPSMCAHSAIRVSNLASLNFSPGRAEVYLPRRSLSDDEGRLSSLLNARSASLDLRDLIPDPLADVMPLNKREKMENAILSVGLRAQDVEGNLLTYCHNLPLQVVPKDSSVIKVLPGVYHLPPSTGGVNRSGVCAFVRVVGQRGGFTDLEVFYTSGEISEKREAHARFPVAVYKDISFLPSTAIVAVAVGSSSLISCINGPIPWQLDAESHFVELDFAEPSGGKKYPSVLQKPQSFVLQENSSISGHNFVLRCESLGNFKVIVIVGNRPSSTNPLPAVLSATLLLNCDVPAKIELIPHLDLPTLSPELPPCPIINRSLGNSETIIPISNSAPLTVEVAFKGLSGYELSGVDSIGVRTRITSDTGKVRDIVSTSEPVVLGLEKISGINGSAKPHFFITPRTLGESAGLLRVHVMAECHYLREQSGILESVLTLKMAPKVVIEPLDNFQLLLHPKAFARVHLSYGSGYFHFGIVPHEFTSKLQSQSCLSVQLSSNRESDDQKSQRDFLLSPKCQGKVTIRATDLCFPARPIPLRDSRKSRKIEPSFDDRVVSIVGLGSLRLYAPSQLELLSKASCYFGPKFWQLFGCEAHAYVRAFDTEGKVFPARFVNLLDLEAISSGGQPTETNPIMVATCSGSPSDSSSLGLASISVSGTQFWLSKPPTHLGDLPGLAKLNLCGKELGPSHLKVVSGSVTSNVEIINVYAPLSLKPCNLNLLLGAAHQMVTTGGPSSSSVTFKVTPEYPERPKLSVTEISEEGGKNGILVRAELGRTGSATVLANATSSTGYVGLDTHDFDAWGLSPPPTTLSSKASCQVNVVALSEVRIGCPLPTPSRSDEGRILVASADMNSSVNGVPVWVEGVANIGDNGVTVTPMGLADIQPPLHFSWRLSPPMPNSPAHLSHWLSQLNVEPDDTNLSSGIVVTGVAAGQVKLHLTVFTEGGLMTGQLISRDSHGTSQPVKQLSVEINFSVVPRLTLLTPLRQNPRILVSPNSRLQLNIPSHILADGGVHYSIKCPSDSPVDMLRVTSSGLLESGVRGRCSAWSDWRLSQCCCHLRVDYHPTSSNTEHNEHGSQSLGLDVVVKAPLYVLALAQSGPHSLPRGISGVPFGGPYPITLSFHDEIGERFDAVAEDLLSLRLNKHRSGLLDYSIVSGGSSSYSPIGRLMLRLTPPLHTDLSSLQAATTLELVHDPPPRADESVTLAPGYLTFPIGPVLDVHGTREFIVGQWACLPLLPQGDGVWSSSDPNLLWIDNHSKFMLPLRAGHVHLQFTPSTETGTPTSLLGKLILNSICSKSGAHPHSRPSTSSVMPVGLELAQEVPIHIVLAPAASAANSSCASTVAWSVLSEISPLTCSARLELGGNERDPTRWVSLPNWLRGLLLAERYDSALSLLVEPDLMAALSNPVVQSADFRTKLIPSVMEEGAWICVVRPGDPGDYSRLAVLPYGSRLVVEAKGNCGAASDGVAKEVIIRSELTLAPAFRVLVPLLHLSNPEPLTLTPRTPVANLLVFIPPATLAQIEFGANTEQTLKARSQRPDLVAIASAPRPVYSVSHVKAALDHMANEQGYSGGMGTLFRNLSLMMENEAQASVEQAFGNGLIWTIGVRSLPTKAAVDANVEVVLSLKVTGQHVSVPIHVQTRSLRAGDLLEIGSDFENEEKGYGPYNDIFWINLSWFNLLLLIFLTILLLLASHVVTRSLSGADLGGVDERNLPPLPNTEDASSHGSLRLWSQGYGLHGRGNLAQPTHISPKFRTPADSASSPFGDTLGLYSGEQVGVTSRPRGVSSPSRLREAFDNSL